MVSLRAQMFPILLLCVFLVEAANAQNVRITGRIGRTFLLNDAIIRAHSENLLVKDPCFPDQGTGKFSGIPLAKLLRLTGGSSEEGVTFIASNQYIVHYTDEDIKSRTILVANRLNGKPIRNNKGGPFKTMPATEFNFPCDAYCWYVQALVVGSPRSPVLSVETNAKIRKFTYDDLDPLSEESKRTFLPIPRGFRSTLPPLPRHVSVREFYLAALVKKASASFKTVTLFSKAGNKITLSKALAELPTKIVWRVDGETLKPGYGGPYSVIFPVERHPELLKKVPKSGAFFFLEKIVVR